MVGPPPMGVSPPMGGPPPMGVSPPMGPPPSGGPPMGGPPMGGPPPIGAPPPMGGPPTPAAGSGVSESDQRVTAELRVGPPLAFQATLTLPELFKEMPVHRPSTPSRPV